MRTATWIAIQRRRQTEATDAALLAARAGYLVDDWQRDVLRSTHHQILMNCSRQSGKSTITALMALHQAIYTDSSLVLLLSPSLRQSQELFRKTKSSLRALGRDAQSIEEESSLRVELANGSRIVCLPGKEGSVRGYSSVSLLIIDEAARVEDELYQAVRPMLAVSRGRIVLLSTPFGKRGFFWRTWNEPQGWHVVTVNAYSCPRIDREWLESERLQIPDMFFRSEYLCEFTEAEDSVFRYDDVQAAFSSDLEPIVFNG
jgi:hypothetical protein